MRPDFVLLEQRGLTTLAFVAIEGGEPVYTFYNNGTADTLMQIDEFPSAVFAETRILHCVGSVSLLGGSTPQAVIATAERLKGQALISFDPNIRANMDPRRGAVSSAGWTDDGTGRSGQGQCGRPGMADAGADRCPDCQCYSGARRVAAGHHTGQARCDSLCPQSRRATRATPCASLPDHRC
ncbi:MAG: hypothetical protein HC893_11840 [Chloroflexaceae bacterium]|nr:hypothetical protein [Chloroflexaceae bacterium]